MQDITFNNFNLNKPWILVNQVRGIDDQDDGDIQALRLSRGDGRTFQDKKFNGRTVSIVLTIIGSNKADFQAKLDTLKRAFYSQIRGLLDIPYSGARRGWKATTESITMTGALGRGYTQQVNITLLTEAFGFDLVDSETVKTGMSSGISLAPNIEEITVSNPGTYYALPTIILDFSWFDNIQNVKVENVTLNQELNIQPPSEYYYKPLNNTDFTVMIDASQARVFWEGEDKRTSGVFPFLWIGDNTFKITTQGDRMNFDATVKHKNRYL